MAGTASRRPIPAIVFILALSLLAALVWWRVLHRAEQGSSKTNGSSSCASKSGSAVRLPAPKAIAITVLNGSGKDRLAQTTSITLHSRGFKIARYGNDSQTVTGVGEIRYTVAAARAASVLHAYVPASKLVLEAGTGGSLTISLGTTFTAKNVVTVTAAKTGLAKASKAPAPTCTPTAGTR